MYAAFNLPSGTMTSSEKKPQNRLFQRLVSGKTSFSLYFKESAKRKDLEQYIHDKYQSAYDAELNHYMPCFLTMEGDSCINSTLGVRTAKRGKLFVEQYSAKPIDEEIQEHCNTEVSRDEIVEIGNLAALKPGSSQLLLVILVAFLHRSGYKWATFSATEDVQKITNKLGFTTYKLCEAKSRCLNGDAKDWGNYYDSKPYLIAGDVEHTYKKLQDHRLYGLVLSYFDENIKTLSKEFDKH